MTTKTDVTTPLARRDLTQIVLAVLLIGVLIAGSFWVLRPFLLALIWASMIVVATWPLMLGVEARFKRRTLAVIVMSTAMLLIFVVPMALAVLALVNNMDTITAWVQSLTASGLPGPPDWVQKIPVVGARIAERWMSIAASGKEGLIAQVGPYLADTAKWLAAVFGGVGVFTLEFLLTVLIAAILYANGEAARETAIRFGRRLAGGRGEDVVILAGQAVRAVALGVVVTALVQTVLAGIGLAVAGVPFAGVLTAVVLILCIAQIGPLVILIPAVIWLYWDGQTVWGTVLLIWTIAVAPLDNILRPILIRKGADLPLLLIFAGVIGGLFAFGIIGLFVGPVVLAVTYTLLKEWLAEQPGE